MKLGFTLNNLASTLWYETVTARKMEGLSEEEKEIIEKDASTVIPMYKDAINALETIDPRTSQHEELLTRLLENGNSLLPEDYEKDVRDNLIQS